MKVNIHVGLRKYETRVLDKSLTVLIAGIKIDRKIHLVTVKSNVQRVKGNTSEELDDTARQSFQRSNLVCFLIKVEVWIKKNTNSKLLSGSIFSKILFCNRVTT